MQTPPTPPDGPAPAGLPTGYDSPVLLQREGALRRLLLNRPDRLNAIDLPMAQAFEQHCAQLLLDPTVRVVVLEGAGPCFGAGGDLGALAAAGDAVGPAARALIEAMHRGLLSLTRLAAPVIASVHGSVAGGSMSLALGCDLVIAADDARFNLAYARVAASCDVGASWHLPRRVGLGRALQIALLCPTLDAATALQTGLVQQVVPAAERQAVVDALAATLAAGPTQAFGRLKRLLRAAFDTPLAQQLDDERDGFIASTATADFHAALDAFFTRTPARFTGQ